MCRGRAVPTLHVYPIQEREMSDKDKIAVLRFYAMAVTGAVVGMLAAHYWRQ